MILNIFRIEDKAWPDMEALPHTWRQHAITWTNVDHWLVKFCGIDLEAISQGMPKLLLRMSVKISFLKSLPYLPRAHELTCVHNQFPQLVYEVSYKTVSSIDPFHKGFMSP